jgi:hypothetical protein
MWGLGGGGAVIVAVMAQVGWVTPSVPILSAVVWGIPFYVINTQRYFGVFTCRHAVTVSPITLNQKQGVPCVLKTIIYRYQTRRRFRFFF